MTRVKRERGGWSVPTKTARWNDRLKFAEVQFTDCARRCRGRIILEVLRQAIQPRRELNLRCHEFGDEHERRTPTSNSEEPSAFASPLRTPNRESVRGAGGKVHCLKVLPATFRLAMPRRSAIRRGHDKLRWTPVMKYNRGPRRVLPCFSGPRCKWSPAFPATLTIC